jgi:hypothetical protein
MGDTVYSWLADLSLRAPYADLPYCRDDYALRWHIHPIPLRYIFREVPGGDPLNPPLEDITDRRTDQ